MSSFTVLRICKGSEGILRCYFFSHEIEEIKKNADLVGGNQYSIIKTVSQHGTVSARCPLVITEVMRS